MPDFADHLENLRLAVAGGVMDRGATVPERLVLGRMMRELARLVEARGRKPAFIRLDPDLPFEQRIPPYDERKHGPAGSGRGARD